MVQPPVSAKPQSANRAALLRHALPEQRHACCPGCDSPRTGVQILVDTLEAVAPEHQALVRRAAGSAEASAVDAHAVALFLYAQLYIRQARPGRYPI